MKKYYSNWKLLKSLNLFSNTVGKDEFQSRRSTSICCQSLLSVSIWMSKNTFMYVLLLSEIIGLVVSHSYLALVFALAENFNSVFCTSQYYWGSVISTSSCLIIIDWRQNILCTMYIFPLSCLVPISNIKVYVSINFLSNVEYVLDFYQVPLCLEITTMVSS